jgi:xanthine/uracil permease
MCIRILSGVDYATNRNNLMIVAVGIGVGMLTLVAPNIFDKLPRELKPILDSGILLTTIVAVLLNAFFNGMGSDESAQEGVSAAAIKSGALH